MSYVYVKSEPGLWTVGFYSPNGEWHSESDHESTEEAANRTAWLNGSGLSIDLPSEPELEYSCQQCNGKGGKAIDKETGVIVYYCNCDDEEGAVYYLTGSCVDPSKIVI